MSDLPEQIDSHIYLAARPSGDRAATREREVAAQFLKAHAAESATRLEQLVEAKPAAWDTPRLVELIGYLAQEQSVPLLVDLLKRAIPDTSRAAGRALGAIRTADAQQTLLAGLAAEAEEVRIAALEGARVFGGAAWCEALAPILTDPVANVRYYALNTAVALRCLANDQLERLARDDDDPYVRQLAQFTLSGTTDETN